MIRYFKNGVGGGWELNFVTRIFNLRIAEYQLALWINYKTVFNLSRKSVRKGI